MTATPHTPVLITSADRKLIAQAARLAAAHTSADLRAYLASQGSTYADDTDLANVYAACLGNAQSILTSLVAILGTDDV